MVTPVEEPEEVEIEVDRLGRDGISFLEILSIGGIIVLKSFLFYFS